MPPATLAMTPVRDDRDWRAVEELFRIDHLEEDRRAGRAERPVAATHQAISLRRGLSPVTYFLARRRRHVDGCIAVGTPAPGVAMIEDVFVHPDARGAGIATQMLRFAVTAARESGAGPLLVGAEVDDTPKHLYARFGFEPTAVTRSHTLDRSAPPR